MQCHQCFEAISDTDWFLLGEVTKLCSHCLAWLYAPTRLLQHLDPRYTDYAENVVSMELGIEAGEPLQDRQPIIVAATLMAERRGECGEAI